MAADADLGAWAVAYDAAAVIQVRLGGLPVIAVPATDQPDLVLLIPDADSALARSPLTMAQLADRAARLVPCRVHPLIPYPEEP